MTSLILGAVTAPVWLGLFLLNANAWRNTFRLYGSAALRAAIAHGHVSWSSAQRVWVIVTIVGFAFLLGFTPVLLQQSFPIPVLLVMGSVYLDNISRRLMPPSVLVLTTSTEHGVLLAGGIKSRLMRDYFGGIGISFLLRASVRDDLEFQYFYGLGPHNIRQVGDSERDWKDGVRRLIRLAPCIVLDLRQGTEPMHEELRLVIEDRCLQKTALLTAAGLAPKDVPAGQVFRSTDQLADWVTMYLGRQTQTSAAPAP